MTATIPVASLVSALGPADLLADPALVTTVEALAARPLLTNWEHFTMADQDAIVRHHRAIADVWRYCLATGNADARVVSDDGDDEPGGGFRAVAFTWHGRAVVARTVWDVQYYFE